ncbi:MAG: N-acetylmuramoyl-L-alanine amidase [Pseudomonadota bacterium]
MIRVLCAIWLMAGVAVAQELTGIARVDPLKSTIEDGWFGQATLTLSLSQGVPYRVYTLDAPPRLVVDFREVDWGLLRPQDLLPEPGAIESLRFGAFRPGWSRLVAALARPKLPDEIAMQVDPESGRATLTISLRPADADSFAARSGAPDDALPQPIPRQQPSADDAFVVVIDPGHGGVDPGADGDGTPEKDLMLSLAIELREALRRAGDVDVVLTRDRDIFVSLPRRVAIAHEAGADLFLSLHADALSQGQARGATVYTLSDDASDAASARLAAQHDRDDILSGVDLTRADDVVAGVLMDLARQETAPRSDDLAAALIASMTQSGGPMNSRPRREGAFSVLKSADIPSVLIEVGFLSDQRDLMNLRDPAWRADMVQGLTRGILTWRDDDLAKAPLRRK